MRNCFLVAAIGLSAFVAVSLPAIGRPLDGVYARETDVPAEGWKITKRFRGGERASVQVTHVAEKRPTTVQITIHDDQGNIVAEDKGRGPAGDVVAVIWYPPRDADYRIVVRNTEAAAVPYFVAIR